MCRNSLQIQCSFFRRRKSHERLLTVMKIILIGSLAALAVGCGDSNVQTITGRVAHPTFGANVDTVVVTHNGSSILEAPVAADGTFKVQVAPGTGYSLSFRTTANRVSLISP